MPPSRVCRLGRTCQKKGAEGLRLRHVRCDGWVRRRRGLGRCWRRLGLLLTLDGPTGRPVLEEEQEDEMDDDAEEQAPR